MQLPLPDLQLQFLLFSCPVLTVHQARNSGQPMPGIEGTRPPQAL